MEPGAPRPYYARVDAAIIAQLRPPLWMLLGAALIVVCDITFGSVESWGNPFTGTDGHSGFRVDLLHDSIGYLIAFLALAHLRRVPSPDHTKRFIPAVAWVLAAGVAVSLFDMLVGWQHGALGLLLELFSLAELLAVVALLWTLMSMCEAAQEHGLTRSWRHAIVAVLVIWTAPAVFLSVASVALRVTGADPVRIDLSSAGAGCVVLLILALPLVWIGIAFFRTSGWAAPARLSQCHVCGYPVTELPEPRCPECGTTFATDRGSPHPGA